MAEAVREVHSRGFIHRDICPRNFICTPEKDSLKKLCSALIGDEKLGAVTGKFRAYNKNRNLLTRMINMESVAFQWIIQANPMTPILEAFRYAFLGAGTVDLGHLLYSFAFMLAVVFLGGVVFNRVEQTFMDTV